MFDQCRFTIHPFDRHISENQMLIKNSPLIFIPIHNFQLSTSEPKKLKVNEMQYSILCKQKHNISDLPIKLQVHFLRNCTKICVCRSLEKSINEGKKMPSKSGGQMQRILFGANYFMLAISFSTIVTAAEVASSGAGIAYPPSPW